MDESKRSWSCRRFSLANASDDRPGDIAYLLRRVADEIDDRGIDPMDFLNLSLEHEMTAQGPRWSITVFWDPD